MILLRMEDGGVTNDSCYSELPIVEVGIVEWFEALPKSLRKSLD